MKIWAGIALLAFIDVVAAFLAVVLYANFILQPSINDTTDKQLNQLNYRLSTIEQNVANINDRLSDADIQSMRWKILMIDAELSKMQGNKNIGE